jgi:hypothetical protein
MIRTILREYIPASWFHPVGIRKVLRRLEPLLPDVSGRLFLTFTLARETCGGDPEAAFEYARKRLRKVFYRLRQGVEYQGRTYAINAPYCVKVEFHEDGWAHFHVIFLTRRFLPGALLNELWGLGRCNVERIKSQGEFRYLLKYVCKGYALPEWILKRRRLRVFQSSHGFLKKPEGEHAPEAEEKEEADEKPRSSKRRFAGNIGERLSRWARLGQVVAGEIGTKTARYSQLVLRGTFQELLGQLVLPVAREGRYLGNGQILITEPEDLSIWLTNEYD